MVDHVWLWFGWPCNKYGWQLLDVDWPWLFLVYAFGSTTWCKLWCMLQCDIAIDEHHNVTWTLMNIALQHTSMFMLHSDIHQGLCHIVTYIKVYIALWDVSMVMSHCNIHSSSCRIVTTINCCLTLCHSSKFTLYCDITSWPSKLSMFDYGLTM